MIPSADRSDTVRPLFRTSRAGYLDDQLVISTGENEFDLPMRVDTPLRRGLKVAVTLNGKISCRINDQAVSDMVGPSVCLFVSNDAPHRREQIFAPGTRLRYAIVQMTPALIEDKFGLPFERLMTMGKRHDGGRDPVFLTCPADKVIQSIASKIMGCPLQGITRDLYLIGKALELVAMSIEQLLPSVRGQQGVSLPLSEIERIQAAREILVLRYRAPPSLTALAREAGLNTRKLNSGFRQLFGMTVHAFLQEHRLQIAYQKISGSEASISGVAYEVGYAPAHFATIFRKRFGLSPSELR
ncbi:AraC family transcriptional regulator [Bosea sp. 685]|uniref:helix-turn-helix transcriptional regulator n=1 Tax=Bosea sp. 685 TaxID=3080057 RepID=UPI0028930A72|nr:AraC family transcriptional regulator [Bosea sp. 685]WNJ93118.1 AraC family transcriptional regulator [Bosea sp. 685]